MIPARVLALLLAALAMLSQPAHSASACGPVNDIIAAITGPQYREKLQDSGTVNSIRLVLIYANDETGTWSIVVVTPGMACVIGAGTNWKREPLGDPA